MDKLVAMNALDQLERKIRTRTHILERRYAQETGCPLDLLSVSLEDLPSATLEHRYRQLCRHEEEFGQIESLLRGTERALERWETLEELPNDVAHSLLWFSVLDLYTRLAEGGNLQLVFDPEEVFQVQALYRIVPWEQLRPSQQVYLNPTFNEGSERLGGSDADLIVDDCLIDIKAVKENKLEADMVRQVVAYALLTNRFGVTGQTSILPIRRVGIYFARGGQLVTWPLEQSIRPEDHDAVLEQLFSSMPVLRERAWRKRISK